MFICVYLWLISAQGAPAFDLPALEQTPVRLAWSRDDRQLYLATAASLARNAPPVKQFVVDLESSQVTPVDRAPDWVGTYWDWKADRTSQHWPDLTIDVKTERKKIGASNPSTGAMTRDAITGGTMGDGTGAGVVDKSAGASETQLVYSLLLKGHVIEQSAGEPPNPGLTFSWVPGGDGPVMVFADERGHLRLLQKNGRDREVKDANKASLPAVSWSGSRLAYLEQKGRKEWALHVIGMP